MMDRWIPERERESTAKTQIKRKKIKKIGKTLQIYYCKYRALRSFISLKNRAGITLSSYFHKTT